jgi:mannitol-specific phosphotransferase system IIBC component
MRNLWIKYTLIRLGLFALLTIVIALIGATWLVAAVLAAMISFAVSVIFLSGMRDEMSKQIYQKRNKSSDSDADFEDKLKSDAEQAVTKKTGK